MTRLPDWEKRWHAFIEAWRARPYLYGESDCMMFVADGILAVTGEDLAAPWRGCYATEDEANAILADHGGVIALVSSVLGDPFPIGHARRADVVMGPVAPGFCLGTHAAFMGEDGLSFRPLHQCRLTWRIGRE